jgi:hypothetical protein
VAKIWFCFEGDHPTKGEANAECQLSEAVELLQLTEDKYLGDDPEKVRFGSPGDRLASIRGYQHVVVEIENAEARGTSWKAGYYYSPLKPSEASQRLRAARSVA